MSAVKTDACTSCGHHQRTVYKCDACGDVSAEKPIQATFRVYDEVTTEHFCRMACLYERAQWYADDGDFSESDLQDEHHISMTLEIEGWSAWVAAEVRR